MSTPNKGGGWTVWIIIAALAVALVRFMVPTHPLTLVGSYEAVAHLMVGSLIGAWLVSRKWLYLGLVLGLSAVELVAFFSR